MGNIVEITDFDDSKLDIYARLSESQLLHFYEPKGGIFIAESPIVIGRALDAGYEPISALIEHKDIEGQGREILERLGDIDVYAAEYDVLTKLTGFALTRGMLCAMRRKELASVSEICEGKRRIAVLENVVNPTNVGAIFRSAAALNMVGVLLTGNCSDPLYRRAARDSMGCVFQIPWTYLDEKEVDWLHENGFKTVAMALKDDSISIDDRKLMEEEKLAIIMGTEAFGLAQETIDKSDYTVMIPMAHGVDSLNVAAASAIAFWQLGRK